MTDITERELYISKLVQVMRAEHTYKEKANAVTDRYSDCLVYILGGSCKYTFADGNSFTVCEGDILYLAHHSAYEMERGRDGYRVLYCDFFFDCSDMRKSAVYRGKKTNQAEARFRRLYKSYLASHFGGLSEQMSELYGIYNEVMLLNNAEYVGADARSKVERAKAEIEERYGDSGLSVSTLAAECGFSEVYFRKLFKSIYRASPSEYICSVRLKNAEHLMLHTDMSLEECARSCGFSSVGYFCRVFKNSYGISPAKYRRENSKVGNQYSV